MLLIGNLGCLFFLFVGAKKDVKVADTKEINQRENHYNVCVNILSLSESILFIQKRTQNWTNEFTKASASDEDARNVVIELLNIVIAVVSLLDCLEHLRQDWNRDHSCRRPDNHETENDHGWVVFEAEGFGGANEEHAD